VNITSIVTLQLHGLPHLTELGPLGSLSNLRDLDLSVHGPSHRNSVAPDLYPTLDITPLALCGQLVYINLRFRNVEDLSPLATCTNLQRVILDHSPWLDRERMSQESERDFGTASIWVLNATHRDCGDCAPT
jgi:hypothetical protein